MERKFENVSEKDSAEFLRMASENFMANLPIFIFGFGIAIALGWDALA